ncbi:MAG: polymerase, sigma-24 subunit, subfamily [Verrucomicrobiales bacterium]|nr:polymerase, sigma-24 subunit, subfamily [Verrucomicrobiales bacterium]
MNDQTDSQLLQAYAEKHSEAAFTELVRRHADFVYSAARRMVCDPHLAEDVTQGVFVAFAKNARQLTDRAVLSGWLHRTAQNIAAQTVRTIERRRAREQEAAAMNDLLSSDSDPTWNHIAPHLDAALGDLNDTDRDALFLRYFQRKSAREMAQALGVSDEAAQKRVNRAVERLRELFLKRGVTVGASGLVVVISTNAVQAAPLGLVGTLTSASLSGAGGSSLTLLKVMTMTKLKITLISAVVIAAVSVPLVMQQQSSETLRKTNESLQAEIAQLKVQNENLANRLVQSEKAQSLSQDEFQELLRLRGTAESRHGNRSAIQGMVKSPAGQLEKSSSADTAAEDVARQLALSVIQGDASALDKIAEMSTAERQSFRTNEAGLNDTQRGDLARKTFAPLHTAFDVLSEAALNGNENAMQAIERSMLKEELRGSAIECLGLLAGKGDEVALNALLNPQQYKILLSSTVSALKPAADNGNQRAIDALAAVAVDEKQRPLWYMAASSLQKAAASGNSTAVDALVSLSRSTNSSVQRAAVIGLKGAAANQNSKAADALRGLSK